MPSILSQMEEAIRDEKHAQTDNLLLPVCYSFRALCFTAPCTSQCHQLFKSRYMVEYVPRRASYDATPLLGSRGELI